MEIIDFANNLAEAERKFLVAAHVNRKKETGESLFKCEECEKPIPEKRRIAEPGCRLCVPCKQEEEDRKWK